MSTASAGRAARTAEGSPGALVVLLLASTLSVMAGAVLTPVTDLLRRELDLGPTGLGLLLTIHSVSLAVVSPFVGRLLDARGTRPVLAAGLVVYALAGAAGLLVDDIALLLLTRLVFGIGVAAVFTGTTVALVERGGPLQDRLMGWRSTAISLGGVTFPLLGGTLGAVSWHAPFAVYLVGLPLAVLTAVALPASPLRSRTSERPHHVRVVDLLRAHPRLVAVYVLQLVASALLYTVLVYLPVRLGELDATTPLLAAVAGAMLSGTMAVVGLAYARGRARFGDLGLLRAALLLWVLSLLLLGTTHLALLVVVAAVVFGIGMGVVVPAVTSLVGRTAPEKGRGVAMALLATTTFAGQLGAPLVAGPVIAATSVTTCFLAAAAVAAVATALTRR